MPAASLQRFDRAPLTPAGRCTIVPASRPRSHAHASFRTAGLDRPARVCCALVLLLHVWHFAGEPGLQPWAGGPAFAPLFSTGWAGVDVFACRPSCWRCRMRAGAARARRDRIPGATCGGACCASIRPTCCSSASCSRHQRTDRPRAHARPRRVRRPPVPLVQRRSGWRRWSASGSPCRSSSVSICCCRSSHRCSIAGAGRDSQARSYPASAGAGSPGTWRPASRCRCG